jgi:hypothetical protein
VRPRRSHIFAKAKDGWYVEPRWCSKRLFEVEKFSGTVYDPAVGQGNITTEARAAGYRVVGSDIVDRGHGLGKGMFFRADFLTVRYDARGQSIVSNPPFDFVQEFCERALEIGAIKVAMIMLVRRLNAARWLHELPLRRVWLLTPRPSMPPGEWLAAGNVAGGGKQDFCWLSFEAGWRGRCELRWLERGEAA